MYLLSVQALAVICIIFWGIFSTFLLLWLVNKITPLRMNVEDEILGADYTEHNIMPSLEAIERDMKSSTSVKSDREHNSNDGDEKDEKTKVDGRNVGENVMSQGFRLHDNNKMADIYKTYLRNEMISNRSKATARDNLAFQHDDV